MSFTDGSSDSEWKETKMKTDRIIKQEQNNSLNKPKYSQKFVDKWLNIFHPWLARDVDDDNKPFCRACQCTLDCNRCHLQRHERTTKHARNLDILINKGEGAARQNLSLRQERSKYYQQKLKQNSSIASSQDDSDMGMDTEEFIEEYVHEALPTTKTEPDGGDDNGFHFVQTDAPGDQYTEEGVLKQEVVSADGRNADPLPVRSHLKGNIAYGGSGSAGGGLVSKTKKAGVKKERMKLLMQIQKDKNDLLESFKELMGTSIPPQSQAKEKHHVDLFFESVSTSVKALSPKLIAESKMRVSQLICELELRALTENESVNDGGGPVNASVVVSQDAIGVGGEYIINQPVDTVVHHVDEQHDAENQYDTLS